MSKYDDMDLYVEPLTDFIDDTGDIFHGSLLYISNNEDFRNSAQADAIAKQSERSIFPDYPLYNEGCVSENLCYPSCVGFSRVRSKRKGKIREYLQLCVKKSHFKYDKDWYKFKKQQALKGKEPTKRDKHFYIKKASLLKGRDVLSNIYSEAREQFGIELKEGKWIVCDSK